MNISTDSYTLDSREMILLAPNHLYGTPSNELSDYIIRMVHTLIQELSAVYANLC